MCYNGLNNMFFPLCQINNNHSVTSPSHTKKTKSDNYRKHHKNTLIDNKALSLFKIDDHEKAESILDKLSQLCDLFDMGAYNRLSTKFDYYVAVKDASKVLRTMDALLENTDSLLDFTKSDLFEHMEFKKSDPLYLGKIQENLLEQFRSDESYEFVRSSPEWIAFEKKWYSGIGQK